ncbi:MAG: SanA/YdcF family protein [Panacagrimonas sp.]
MRRKRRLRMLLWWSLGLFVLVVLLCNRWVINSTDAYLYTSAALLPENDIGIVLGTSSYTRDGDSNPQFFARVDSAVQLYRQGKVKHLIVSGANPDNTYNEPRRMWQELTKAGIPAKDITMDFAGFRTFDSLARAKEVFNLDRCTLITQRYHAYRAVFLGKKMGMRVVAFVAPASPKGDYGSRNPVREIFARVKAVLDLFVLSTTPRFLGQAQPIEVPPAGDTYTPPSRES